MFSKTLYIELFYRQGLFIKINIWYNARIGISIRRKNMAIDLERHSTTDKGYSDSLYEVHFVPVTERAEYQEGPIAKALEELLEERCRFL